MNANIAVILKAVTVGIFLQKCPPTSGYGCTVVQFL